MTLKEEGSVLPSKLQKECCVIGNGTKMKAVRFTNNYYELTEPESDFHSLPMSELWSFFVSQMLECITGVFFIQHLTTKHVL